MDNFCIIVNKDRDEQLELAKQVQDFLKKKGKKYCTYVESLNTGETVVSEISELRESEKLNNSAITVYFPDCEETLWDIAKRYNTTVESIVLENNLVGETTKDIKMLFIPSGT